MVGCAKKARRHFRARRRHEARRREQQRAGFFAAYLLADTLGDELKLATQGKARVFGIALKDRAAIFSAAFSGDGAYWIDSKTGPWITSPYYRSDLPKWVQDFHDSKRAEK